MSNLHNKMKGSKDVEVPRPLIWTDYNGVEEFCQIHNDSRVFRRKKGTEEWFEHTMYDTRSLATGTGSRPQLPPPAPPSPPPSFKYISLVMQQGKGEELLHWCVFVAELNKPGNVYQVKGVGADQKYLPSEKPVDIVKENSFVSIYYLALIPDGHENLVKDIAERMPTRDDLPGGPPENSQGWTVRLMATLVEKEIIPASRLAMAKAMVQPL